MSVGERIRALVDASGQQPKAIATEWSRRWTENGGKGGAVDTVKSRLSNLCNDDAEGDGLKYFFADPARRNLLFDVLEVEAAERDAVTAMAEEQVQAGGAPPRLVVDLTSFEETKVNLGAALLALLTEDPVLRPVQILVTSKQADSLSMRFARQPKVFAVVEVADTKAADVRVKQVMQRSALVASSRPFADITRWAALDIAKGGKAFVLEPPNAIELYLSAGRLPGPVSVVHRIKGARRGAPTVPPLPDPSAAGVRRLIIELAAGGPSDADMPTRLAWARHLGVEAASRTEERAEAAVLEAGFSIANARHGELAQTLARAALRPVSRVALREKGVIHIVNGEFAVTADIEGAVVTHTVACAEPAVKRLRETIAAFTEDDWRDDPVLHRAMARLTTGGNPSLDLKHARTWLLRVEAPLAVPSSIKAEPVALRKLVEGPLLEVELLYQPVSPDRAPARGAEREGIVLGDDIEGWKDVLPRVYAARPTLISRTTRFGHLSGSHDALDDLLGGGATDLAKRNTSLDDACLDNFTEHWGSPTEVERTLTRIRSQYYGYGSKPLEVKAGSHGPETWNTATAQVAMARRALRRAIDRGDFEPLGDGRLLVDLGTGICAIVSMRSWPAATSLRGALYLEAGLPPLECVATHGGSSGSTGPLLPRMVWLAGEGVAADITFVGSALLGLGAPPNEAPRPPDRDRRAEYDDDDD